MHETIQRILNLCPPSLFFPLNNNLAHRSQRDIDDTENNNFDLMEKEKCDGS